MNKTDLNMNNRNGSISRRWQLFVRMMVMVTTAFLSAAPEKHDPKAAKLMDDYVEATGGKAAYEKIRSRVSKGRIIIGGSGIELKGITYNALPKKSYSVFESAVTGKMEQGSNGDIAWEISAMSGARIKEGEERDLALITGRIDAEINWRQIYETVEITGEDDVDGKPCHIVTATPKGGKPMISYIDKKTKLVLKAVLTVTAPQGTIKSEIFPLDYKKVDGILVPFKMKMKQMGMEMNFTFDSIEHNTDIHEKIFALPPDIKALTEKKN